MSPFDLYDTGEDTWKWQEYLTQPISPALRAILCKLLQPATRRRYQSAVEVLADLDVPSSPASSTLGRLEGAIAQNAAQAEISDHCEDIQPVKSIINAAQAVGSKASATIYDPQTQARYHLPSQMNLKDNSRKNLNPTQKLSTYFSKFLSTQTTDAVKLIFVALIFFILTCVGSMLMLSLFINMEQQSPSQTQVERSPSLSSKL